MQTSLARSIVSDLRNVRYSLVALVLSCHSCMVGEAEKAGIFEELTKSMHILEELD